MRAWWFLSFALLLAGPRAWAFTLGNPSSSAQLGWSGSTLTVKVNTTGCGVSSAIMEDAVDMAIDLWNGVSTSSLTIKRKNSSSITSATVLQSLTDHSASGTDTAQPEIVCSSSFQSDTGGDPDFVAGSTRFAAPDGPRLEYAYIILNADAGTTVASMANIYASGGKTALAVIIAHEMGHALGLGHSSKKAALMYYNTTEKEDLRLSQDDVDGMTYLYPREAFGCGTLAVAGAGGRSGGSGGSGPGAASVALFWIAIYAIRRAARWRLIPV